jgi:hypothetical protein
LVVRAALSERDELALLLGFNRLNSEIFTVN